MKLLPKIQVQWQNVSIRKVWWEDYLCLSDMAANIGKEDSIKNWMKNKDTIEFLGTWEKLHNESFNIEWYENLRNTSGSGRFLMSPQKWKDVTNAIGISSQAGKWWGTYAHIDIALEFAGHLNPAFKLYIIKDYQRLKKIEQEKLDSNRDQKRALSKVNYGFMTDAIKSHLIPENLKPGQIGLIYAEEADLVNLALFNITAHERRVKFPKEAKEDLNMRDFAGPEQLVVLANLEFKNSEMIAEWIAPDQRLISLNKIAIQQMTKLTKNENTVKKVLPGSSKKYLN